MPDGEVEKFVTAAAFASRHDEEWQERERGVRTTVKRLSKGQAITGIPRLSALLGEEVVAKVAEWLGFRNRLGEVRETSIAVKVQPWPTPKPEAFHGLAHDIVALIEPHSEADPVALLSQFLVGFGNVIGRSAYVQVEADKHFSNLFAVLVGPTSKGRKGSALSQIQQILRQANPAWSDTAIVSGLSSGEGLIWNVRDPIFSNDGSKVVDAGVTDKRLFVIETEFAQPLKLMARETNILSTVIRQGWDSGNLRTLTKNSPAQASGAHISIIGHIS